MREEIEYRAKIAGYRCILHKETVREVAKALHVSKSTVHKDLTERLPKINPQLASKVAEVLQENKEARHIRGGEATRRLWLCARERD